MEKEKIIRAVLVIVLIILVAIIAAIYICAKIRGSIVTGGTQFPQVVFDIASKVPESADYSIFSITNESLYSSLMPQHIRQVNAAFRKISPRPKTVLDGTAHIGVDTANLALLYPDATITAVEMNPETFALLEKNTKTLADWSQRAGRKTAQIILINENSVSYLMKNPDLHFDLVYFDPPWGGSKYKHASKITFIMPGHKQSLPKLATTLIERGQADTVVMKLPANYDFDTFTQLTGFEVSSYRILTRSKKAEIEKESFRLIAIRRQ